MAYTITPEQYNQLNKLDPLVRDEVFASQELNKDFTGITASFQKMGEKIKINNALDAFNDPTGNKMKAYTSELGATGMQYTTSDIAQATKDSNITQSKLDNLDERKINASEGFFDLKYNNKELTFQELNKQIEVNTGIDIGIYKSKKEYSKAIKKVLASMKKGLPTNIYKEREATVWNAYRSVNTMQLGSTQGMSPAVGPKGTAALTEYFELKKDDTHADSILESMFKEPEIYQLWLEENK